MAAPAARIDVTPANARLLVGQRVGLDATVRATNGDIRDDVVTWRSSAPGVVRVSADGSAEALTAGSANITATVGKANGVVSLTVLGSTVGKVEVSADKSSVRTGDVVHLRASARDARGAVIDGVLPTWTVSPGTGQITGDGAFVADQPGVYTVSATYGSTTGTTSLKVGFRDVKRPTTVLGRVPISAVGTAEFWPTSEQAQRVPQHDGHHALCAGH